MKLTNNLNLPGPLFKAICNDSYDPGHSDYTATGLIEPARIAALKERHADELTEDASDRIFSLQGQSMHTILERAGLELRAEGYLVEERFYAVIDGQLTSAQIDVLHPPSGLLQDYKLTSVYKVKDGVTEEYAQQLNIQKYLIENGYYHPRDMDGKEIETIKLTVPDVKISKMEIVALLRDWSKSKYEREFQEWKERCNYPSRQVSILDVPLIPFREVADFISQRITAHEAARGGSLPECTDAERWASPSTWAVMKTGMKRAASLHTSEAAAIVAAGDDKKLSVVHRPGISRRCETYCPVKNFCDQYKKSNK